jgi:hypothetical protein
MSMQHAARISPPRVRAGSRLAPRVATIACALALFAGCGQEVPKPIDLADAGRQLDAVLKAWKEDRPHASLATGDPAIIFTEPLWENGTRLLAYEVGAVELQGRQGRCTAKLTLRDKDGKQYERKIGYQIDTVPRVVIVREGLGL